MTPEKTPAPLEEWPELPPEHIPKPTAWPPTMALAITFLFWGLASSLIISGVGALVFAVALTGWIGDIRHERQPH
jgi:hypothetical protein